MSLVEIDVWSDIACPWCWVGKRNLEAATALVDHEILVTWHAFQLNPKAPPSTGPVDYIARLAGKYGTSRAQAQAMVDRMSSVGAELGLGFDFAQIQPTNTFDAHRVIAFARTKGHQSATKERLFRAYFSEGLDIGCTETLVTIASDIGLIPNEVRELLSGAEHVDDVREDLAQATSMSVSGVPFFVIAGAYAIPGAQPPDALAQAIEKAALQASAAQLTEAQTPRGEVCGLDDCA